MKAIDLTDLNGGLEHDAYQKLAQEHRDVAVRLSVTASDMAGYRDMPMARHHEEALADPKIVEALHKLISGEQQLIGLLQAQLEEYQHILGAGHDGK